MMYKIVLKPKTCLLQGDRGPPTAPTWPERNSDFNSGHVIIPDSKVHGANMGPIWGRQDPGGPHVGPINFVILRQFDSLDLAFVAFG